MRVKRRVKSERDMREMKEVGRERERALNLDKCKAERFTDMRVRRGHDRDSRERERRGTFGYGPNLLVKSLA